VDAFDGEKREITIPNTSSLSDRVQRHSEICKGLTDLYERKNHDYGDSFHKTFLEEGFAMSRIRLSDKLERFKSLTKSGEQKVNDESIVDTLKDMANYAIMTVLEIERGDT
jgi:isopropylmalate/homocitrate/citramalate synthase